MHTVEEMHSNKRGKYIYDTKVEIVHVLIESTCMERYMARYKYNYFVLLYHERVRGVSQ